MVIISISGIIASFEMENESNVTPATLRKSLEKANGDDILITINSEGGSSFHGLEMFSLIKNYPGKTETRIISLAASMGSILALAGQKKSIENTALYYIHNPWSWAVGDYRDFEKEAKFLKDLAGLLAELYAENTNLSKSKAQKLMDEESSFYGDELEALGFETVDTEQTENPASARVLAKPRLQNWKNKMSPEDYMKDLEKVAASISSKKYFPIGKLNIPASAGKDNKTEVIMNLEDFKRDNPDLYAQVVQIGVDQERDRVKAHITLARQANCLNIAIKHIEDGTGFTSSVSAEYMAAGMKNQSLTNRKEDDIDTGGQAGDDDKIDTEVYTQKLLAARGLK